MMFSTEDYSLAPPGCFGYSHERKEDRSEGSSAQNAPLSSKACSAIISDKERKEGKSEGRSAARMLLRAGAGTIIISL